jgi:serine/threonine protein kinase
VFSKVFKVTNIKTKEIKALKAIPIMDNSRNKNPEELKIGMEIGRKCEYLVYYDKIFVEGDFEIIIDYFEKGDIQSYLNERNKLNELVYTSFTHFIFFLLTGNNIRCEKEHYSSRYVKDNNFKLGVIILICLCLFFF